MLSVPLWLVGEGQAFMLNADVVSRFRALNGSLPPADQRRFYPQIGFQDPYVRFSENSLCSLLYARAHGLQPTMVTYFGRRDQFQDVVHDLFVRGTKHESTTVSMHRIPELGFHLVEAAYDWRRRRFLNATQSDGKHYIDSNRRYGYHVSPFTAAY
jgi:hypothetical protein